MAGYTDDTLYDVCVYLTSAEMTVNIIAVESVKNTCTAVDVAAFINKIGTY